MSCVGFQESVKTKRLVESVGSSGTRTQPQAIKLRTRILDHRGDQAPTGASTAISRRNEDVSDPTASGIAIVGIDVQAADANQRGIGSHGEKRLTGTRESVAAAFPIVDQSIDKIKTLAAGFACEDFNAVYR